MDPSLQGYEQKYCIMCYVNDSVKVIGLNNPDLESEIGKTPSFCVNCVNNCFHKNSVKTYIRDTVFSNIYSNGKMDCYGCHNAANSLIEFNCCLFHKKYLKR